MEFVTAKGVEIPALGFGTYPMTGTACRTAVETAMAAGYRHVDTAQKYDNEAAVGRALRASDVPREEVFVVTKLAPGNRAYDDAVASVERSRDLLGGPIDLLLLHTPNESVPLAETLEAMADLRDRGVVSHLGVSNFSVDELRTAERLADAPIVTDQVSYHPYDDQRELLAYCRANDVALTAYSPLCKGKVLEDETVRAIARRHGKTPAQVGLRWLVGQDNVVAIPKASSPGHIAENLDVFDFELSDAERRAIAASDDGLADRFRTILGV